METLTHLPPVSPPSSRIMQDAMRVSAGRNAFEETSPQPPRPFVRSGLVSYYAPYALAALWCALFGLTAAFPSYWWLMLLFQAGAVCAVYGGILHREDMRAMLPPALAACIIGQLHFLILNGGLARAANAAIVSFAVAVHVRSIVRSYAHPLPFVSPHRVYIALFLAALSVYMIIAVAGAAVMLLQFPILGAMGVVFLIVLLMTAHVMALTSHAPSAKSGASWVIALTMAELVAVLLFIPTMPFVAAALVLSLYAPLLEFARDSLALPSRRALLRGGGVMATVWAFIVGTARWS